MELLCKSEEWMPQLVHSENRIRSRVIRSLVSCSGTCPKSRQASMLDRLRSSWRANYWSSFTLMAFFSKATSTQGVGAKSSQPAADLQSDLGVFVSLASVAVQIHRMLATCDRRRL